MNAAVSVQNVSKVYGDLGVVNNLSFDIAKGELFGFLGPNGAGKSTTVRMLTTLTKPTSGTIEVAGYDVVHQSRLAKRSIGVVLQQVSVDLDLTVWENMEYHGRLHHIPRGERQERINRWLEYVELTNRRDALVKTLSGGMKRRLQIARSLLHQPDILFLDEPTVGLDPQTRRRLWEILLDLKDQGMTMLLTTHYMEEVEYLCDRIGILDSGQLIELGTLDELRRNHGEGVVVKHTPEGLQSQFFPNLDLANDYINQQGDRTGIMARESNLEDIFVELTGRQLD
jgi:ABC-2 type transport system ATP-binding protein